MAEKYILILLPMLLFCAAAAPVLDVPSSREAWKKQRAKLLEQWLAVMGPPSAPPLGPVGEPTVISTEQLEDHTRLLVAYQGYQSYLLLPKTPGKYPAMVCLHPTSDKTILGPVGLANRESNHHALHLVRRGYVCIAPANFLWAKPGQTWQQAADRVIKEDNWKTGMQRMLHDAMCAVDYLEKRPEVDPKRIGVIGHSLGGKEALYLAAFDQRIRAAISCEGGIGLGFSNWEADWYLGPQIKSPDFKRDNHEVLALIAPRAFMLIGGGSADGEQSRPYIETVRPLWRLYDADERLKLLVHKDGHNFPKPSDERETVYLWLDAMMKR